MVRRCFMAVLALLVALGAFVPQAAAQSPSVPALPFVYIDESASFDAASAEFEDVSGYPLVRVRINNPHRFWTKIYLIYPEGSPAVIPANGWARFGYVAPGGYALYDIAVDERYNEYYQFWINAARTQDGTMSASAWTALFRMLDTALIALTGAQIDPASVDPQTWIDVAKLLRSAPSCLNVGDKVATGDGVGAVDSLRRCFTQEDQIAVMVSAAKVVAAASTDAVVRNAAKNITGTALKRVFSFIKLIDLSRDLADNLLALVTGSYAGSIVVHAVNRPIYLPLPEGAKVLPIRNDNQQPGTSPVNSNRGVVQTATLNMRSGPGTEYAVVGKLRSGDTMELLGQNALGNWLKIRTDAGMSGWVSKQYVLAPLTCCPVLDAPTPPVPAPPPTPAPPSTAWPTETPTPWPTIWPTETPTFQPTLFPTAEPQTSVSFYADNTSIRAGECTTLRWDVDNVREVHLGDAGAAGNGVAGHGSQQVCLNQSQSYDLRVLFRDGSQQVYGLTIGVEEPVSDPIGALFTVAANQEWQDTGVWLRAGQTVSIQSVSGTWSPWPGYDVDANGCTDSAVCSQDPAAPQNAAPVALHAALIGMIGGGPPFGVGMGTAATAGSDGSLYLRINDSYVSDNSGSITVEIQGMGNP